MRRYTRYLVVVASVVGLLLGSVASAAAQEEESWELITAAGWNCNNYVDDDDPRDFTVFTIEDIPPSRWAGGGWTIGYVWVERRGDGRGYNVCVGWVDGEGRHPWQAVVGDNEADGHGAIAYVTFIPWNGDSDDRIRHYVQESRADGVGQTSGYNVLAGRVKDFYVGVCIIRQGDYKGCNDERGRD